VAVVEPVYLIDASVFVFRAYYSIPPDMADGDGRPVNALYGFARFLGDLLETTRSRSVAIAFDESLTQSFRNQLFPAYKAQREAPPPELSQQFERCRSLCELLGLPAYGSDTYEADDIIGTLTARARRSGRPAVVVSRDKDLSQLIRPGDYFWDFSAGKRYGYDDIAPRFGVLPERMADYLALTGDAVDNIPGVPGVGPKTAGVLMTHFATIDDLYDNLAAVPALPIRGALRIREQLAQHRSAAFLARELTRIACDVPLPVDEDLTARSRPHLARLAAFYDGAGFGAALRRQAERIGQHSGLTEQRLAV
jgi:5'-3' exonuclease